MSTGLNLKPFLMNWVKNTLAVLPIAMESWKSGCHYQSMSERNRLIDYRRYRQNPIMKNYKLTASALGQPPSSGKQ
jgi:hypothetical protein